MDTIVTELPEPDTPPGPLPGPLLPEVRTVQRRCLVRDYLELDFLQAETLEEDFLDQVYLEPSCLEWELLEPEYPEQDRLKSTFLWGFLQKEHLERNCLAKGCLAMEFPAMNCLVLETKAEKVGQKLEGGKSRELGYLVRILQGMEVLRMGWQALEIMEMEFRVSESRLMGHREGDFQAIGSRAQRKTPTRLVVKDLQVWAWQKMGVRLLGFQAAAAAAGEIRYQAIVKELQERELQRINSQEAEFQLKIQRNQPQMLEEPELELTR
ncbi:hypothetical protein NKR23_g1845 [Pleurostoma richardsiae]|uniref:Uncharacterized protein n=1 Tax=Pleurostoma richardsiae TaxID=41990 RepID=A0AA38RRC0_9PEZI|nr:hypothetical protein NKR23_g1845 [Pleurostoma richardsiae]